ncbi:MAG: hypothetical protein IKT56_02650 [Clostridia bacterium]|nr:hypothetical protein [Clostridia bacterium]
MNCLYREKVYKCGEYLEAHIYPVFAVNKKTRRSRYKPSSETQALLNQKNAELYYTRLANANFTSDDIKLELTYNDEHLPSSEEEAVRNEYNFIRRYRRLAKKAGVNVVKYFAKVERGRHHHHIMITGGVSYKEIAELWAPFGYVRRIAPLMFDEKGISDITRYFLKEKNASRRCRVSKNMEKPVEIERTGRLSQKKVAELAKNTSDYTAYSGLYKGYRLAEPALAFHNLFVERDYIVARYYREGANIYSNKPSYSKRKGANADDCTQTIEDSLFGAVRDF